MDYIDRKAKLESGLKVYHAKRKARTFVVLAFPCLSKFIQY
jgi:hypothetical protein